MCTLAKPADAEYRLKSTPQSAAPNELDRPGLPWKYSEFVSPKMSGGEGSSVDAMIFLYSAACVSTSRVVLVWFMRVCCRVTPGLVAPSM